MPRPNLKMLLPPMLKCAVYGASALSILIADYQTGSGFMEFLKQLYFKIAKSLESEVNIFQWAIKNPPVVLFAEIMALILSIFYYIKFSGTRRICRLDELIEQSKDSLQIINEYLEKWQTRKKLFNVNEFSSLTEEPMDVKPRKMEVPILFMAVSYNATRSQLECGDVGDAEDVINISESTLLSVTSLFDEDDSIAEHESFHDEKSPESNKNPDLRVRYLWNAMEESVNYNS